MRNALAARQWEAYYHDATSEARAASITPALYSYRAWLADSWQFTVAASDPRALLTPHQSVALWRAIIADSPAGDRLLEVRHAARWAADAHRLLADWNLGAIDVERADASPDSQAFLGWQRSYRARLADSGWLDESELPREMPRYAAPEALVLLDLGEPTKAQTALFETLRRQGCEIEARTAPTVASTARQMGVRDSTEELRTAASWARDRLQRHPRTRIALVVPDLASDPAAVLQRVRRAFGASGPTVGTEIVAIGATTGAPLCAQPSIGAALCAIELSSARATFATLSRWLRSPYFHGVEGKLQSAAAAAEAQLRSDLSAQLPFLTAYERAGLAGRLATLVPDLAERLRAGLQELWAPRPAATLDVWAQAWGRGLARLGWPAPDSGFDEAASRAWERALTALSQLTAILGPCSQETALEQLRTTVEAPLNTPLPLYGLHVLARAEDIGPGYAGAWLTGVTDRNWPEPARLNPLLPAQLQIRHSMPWSTPADSLARARATLARLVARTPEVVLSWPELVHDYRAAPSPLLAGIPAATELRLRPSAHAAPVHPRALVSSSDPAPALSAARIPGGARTLDAQARCPIRAFCETRLEARALAPIARGLSPRARGVAIHRALELLSANAAIAACAQRALAEVFGAARPALAALFELEAARLRQLLDRFVETERRRPPFRIASVERRAEVRVGDFSIACRLDRVDELGDGTLALIDYKTGASQQPQRWLAEPLASTQLPLYALEVGPSLSAILNVGLSGETIAYRGVARDPSLIVDSLRAVPGDEWTALVERWRTQLLVLVEGYAAGDVRVYAEDWSDAAREYAPLTRVYAHATLRQAGGES